MLPGVRWCSAFIFVQNVNRHCKLYTRWLFQVLSSCRSAASEWWSGAVACNMQKSITWHRMCSCVSVCVDSIIFILMSDVIVFRCCALCARGNCCGWQRWLLADKCYLSFCTAYAAGATLFSFISSMQLCFFACEVFTHTHHTTLNCWSYFSIPKFNSCTFWIFDIFFWAVFASLSSTTFISLEHLLPISNTLESVSN